MFKRGLDAAAGADVRYARQEQHGGGEQPRRVVYLTFDDGPKKDTPELLKVLDDLDVPATFFLVGAGVRAFPENAKLFWEAVTPIGSHS